MLIQRFSLGKSQSTNAEASEPDLSDPSQVRRTVWKLSAPALVEMMFLTLMNVINMVMVGHLGAVSISAVGLSNQPFFLMNAIFVALNVGSTALVARNVGAHRPLQARHFARQSLILTFPIGLIFSIAAYAYAPNVIYFMGGREETLALGSTYFSIVGASLMLLALSTAVFSVLRGAGDTKTPMKISMVANFLVAFFGWILIYGKFGVPALGVVGAAYALFLARVVMAAMALWEVSRSGSVVKVPLRGNYKPDWSAVKEILGIGLPSALEQFVIQGGLVFFVRIVSGLGTDIYAAHQILLNLLGLSFQPGMAFSMASTTLVGQNLGANDPMMAERAVRETRKIGVTMTAFVCVAFLVAGKLFMRIYTSDPDVIALGASAMKIMALLVPAQTSLLITVGGLRGAGDTRFPLYVSLVGVWIIRLSLASLLIRNFGLGLHGAWLAILADQGMRSLALGYRFSTGKWKNLISVEKSTDCKKAACAH